MVTSEPGCAPSRRKHQNGRDGPGRSLGALTVESETVAAHRLRYWRFPANQSQVEQKSCARSVPRACGSRRAPGYARARRRSGRERMRGAPVTNARRDGARTCKATRTKKTWETSPRDRLRHRVDHCDDVARAHEVRLALAVRAQGRRAPRRSRLPLRTGSSSGGHVLRSSPYWTSTS